MVDLQKKTAAGVGWLGLGQLVKHGLQFGIGIILARMLSPHEFGLVGMITVFVGFAGLFSEMGFGAALIQREQVEERHTSSVFWLNLFAGSMLTLLFIALAPLVSRFYGEATLTPLTMLVATSFTIGAFAMVPIALLTREMDFRRLSLIETGAAIGGSLVAIVLAFSGFGVWSLVWRTLITTTITAAALWWITRWRPRVLFDRAAIRDLFGFSSNLLGYRATTYWSQNGNDLIIGKFLGTAALGLYARAYMVLLLPLNEIVRILGRVMFPALSRIQHDRAQVRQAYLQAVAMLSLLLFPVLLGLAVVADDFVLALYGPNWSDVVPVLSVLSVLGAAQSIVATGGWIFQSQGRTDWIFRWGLVSTAVTLTSVFIGVWIGSLLAVAYCYAFAAGVILLYPSLAIPFRLIDLPVRRLVRTIAGPLACSLVMVGAVIAVTQLLPADWPAWNRLLVEVSVGGLVYLASIHLARLDAYEQVRRVLSQRIPRLSRLNRMSSRPEYLP